tara:strand:- start:2185 stop:2979 length:795 start_codon:yes stop_codon:yes gene_type:complete
MKKGISIVLIFMTLILVVNVLAFESIITVETGKPNTVIVFKPANPDTGKSFAEITETSDDSGVVVFDYNFEPVRIKMGFQAISGSGTPLTFLNNKQAIFIPNVILYSSGSVNLNQGEDITITYEPDEEIIEETEEVEETEEIVEEEGETKEETTEIEQESSSGITGKAIDFIKGVVTSTKTYYIVGGIIILLATVMFFKRRMNKKGSFKVTKMSEIKENKEKIDHTDDKLEDAEQKLKEAKEKLEQDKKELRRLEGDEEGDSSE